MSALVLSARDELHALDVERVSPFGLVFEHRFEHRLRLGRRVEELDDLMDLVRDDGVEDHGATIRRGRADVFGPLGGFAFIRRWGGARRSSPTSIASKRAGSGIGNR